jgi:hypothetical protein
MAAGLGLVVTAIIVFWLFDVSSGMASVEQVANRGTDQIDDARESCGVAVTSGPRPGGLEQAVESLQPGIGMA